MYSDTSQKSSKFKTWFLMWYRILTQIIWLLKKIPYYHILQFLADKDKNRKPALVKKSSTEPDDDQEVSYWQYFSNT